MMLDEKKLLFVYNADSSMFIQLEDLIHKTLSPKTYQCRLCSLTYSGIRMRNDWKDFIKSLPIESEFLHKDEFLRRYPEKKNASFPIVFIQNNDSLNELISTEEIDKTENLEALQKVVSEKVSQI